MKMLLAVAAVLLVPTCGYAQAAQSSPEAQAKPAMQAAATAKPCEDLKSEIAARLDAKGVKSYTLDIVDKDKEVTEGKAVGTCEGGAKKIVYKRGTATETTPSAPAKEPSKP